MRNRSKEQGFTLLELIIVMVLISLTASFTIPKIQSSLYSDQLSASTQRFVHLVTETAQEARARHTSFRLRFDPDIKTFSAVPITAGPDIGDRDHAILRAVLADSVDLVNVDLSQEDTFRENNETGIIFTNKGYTRKAALHFENDDGDRISVILSPFLGVARILEGHISLEDDQIMVNR